ncbi:hypothetical protein [Gordonia sp. (in: high G+C Gram-positive bacteria)]|uniref:hypothetical protein n=1 Tax=Gordonia sp. (in: high G+C Gram-positive bacteria) TaxID=84139 RepID=UPI003F99F3DC
MQPSRLFPFATIVAAATAIALTTLPWMNLKSAGLDLSWNGLGIGASEIADLDVSPEGRGWLVVAACVVAILAALISLMPAPSAAPLSRLANVIAAVATTIGALVPLAVMIWPSWFYGDLETKLGAPNLAEFAAPSKMILIPLTLVMLLTAALCAYSSRLRTE